MKRTLLYALFAIIAIATNLLGQELSVSLYQGQHYIVLSVFIGTFVGLATKYLLDKTFIFQYQTTNLNHETKTFILYTAMGVITTLIFWAFEFGFEYLFNSKFMRYTGGVIGLTIGYVTKYHLDKKFVFVQEPQNDDS